MRRSNDRELRGNSAAPPMRACHEGSSARARCQRVGCGGRMARRTPACPTWLHHLASEAGVQPGHVGTFGGRHVGMHGRGAGCTHGPHGGGAGFPQPGPESRSACSSHFPSRTPMLPFTFRGPTWKDDADELACCSLPAAWPAAWTVTPDGGPSYACVIVWRVRLAFPASDTAVELFDWPTPTGCACRQTGRGGRVRRRRVCRPPSRFRSPGRSAGRARSGSPPRRARSTHCPAGSTRSRRSRGSCSRARPARTTHSRPAPTARCRRAGRRPALRRRRHDGRHSTTTDCRPTARSTASVWFALIAAPSAVDVFAWVTSPL